MVQLLRFIIDYLPGLFAEYAFVIKSSKNSGSDISGASILLSSDELDIFVAIGRGEITVDFHSCFDKRKNNWYTLDLIFSLVGSKGEVGIINNHTSVLISKALPEVIDCFRERRAKKTLEHLDELRRQKII